MEVAKVIPQMRVQQPTVEQLGDVPVPQTFEDVVLVPQVQEQENAVLRPVEQTATVPRPQVDETVSEVLIFGFWKAL